MTERKWPHGFTESVLWLSMKGSLNSPRMQYLIGGLMNEQEFIRRTKDWKEGHSDGRANPGYVGQHILFEKYKHLLG